MNITSIKIINIKGIKYQKFDLRLMPNKPNLLVAPNGSGKSSIATALASMNRNRMKLDDNDCYQCNNQNQPELTLTVENDSHPPQTLTANNSQNNIYPQFDITVIRSGLTSKATKRNMGGFTQASASLEIKPIAICKIPPKTDFIYQYSAARSAFGKNGKIIPNITEQLKHISICDVIAKCDISKFRGKRIQQSIGNIKNQINQQSGSSDYIRQWINNNLLDSLKSIDFLDTLAQAVKTLNGINSETEAFLAALQIIEIYQTDKTAFDAALDSLRYTETKKDYRNLLKDFRSSDWQWAEAKEVKTSKKDKKPTELRIVFPPAHQLSNGQRDIITLVIEMHKTLYSSASKPLILVIDEVFDYLDDANLVAFQYYITSLIEEYKKRKKILFPLILTHLAPGVFFDFCFDKSKIHTHYLQKKTTEKSRDMLRLIEIREHRNTKEAIKNELDRHWFHFHPNCHEIASNEWPNGLQVEWRKSDVFHSYAQKELFRYLDDKYRNYDALAVCIAVRIMIEKSVYGLFCSEGQMQEFILTHTTKRKLNYATEHISDIPEIYFLLGLIHNDSLHWNQDRDYLSPLVARLSHPTIKNLIHCVALKKR